MNQQELESRLMTTDEEVLMHGLHGFVRERVRRDVDEHIDRIGLSQLGTNAVDDAVHDIIGNLEDTIQGEINDLDFESRVDEAIDNADIRDLAEDAVETAIGPLRVRDEVESALMWLIDNKQLDRNIWLAYRRPSWWRRALTFIGGMWAPS